MMNQNYGEIPGAKTPLAQFVDRRKHGRVDYAAKAAFLNAAGDENPCLIVNISVGGALLKAKTPPKSGEQVVLYIDNVGRFEGKVVRAGKHTFAVDYRSRKARSKRTADILTQAVNRPNGQIDRRAKPRIRSEASAQIQLATGETVDAEILDISLTGASIGIDPRPEIDALLTVGRTAARVVRHHEHGIGVIFTGSAQQMEQVIENTVSQNDTDATGTNIAD